MEFRNFFNQIFLSKQLNFEEGQLLMFGQPLVMLPATTIVEIQKFIEDNYKGGDKIIYDAAKIAGVKFVSTFKREFRPKSPQKLLETCLSVLGLAGCGKITIIKFDFEKKEATFHVTKSPWAMLRGKADKPVDNFLAGFFAGGCEEIFEKKPIDVTEIQCQVTGKSYCEFHTLQQKKKTKSKG